MSNESRLTAYLQDKLPEGHAVKFAKYDRGVSFEIERDGAHVVTWHAQNSDFANGAYPRWADKWSAEYTASHA